MSQTLDQIYISNPSTAMSANDLLYLVHSPYTLGTDSAILWSNMRASISGSSVWVDVAAATQTMAANTGYIADDGATLVTFTLPATAAVGTTYEIAGKAAGGWTIVYGAGKSIRYGNLVTTTTTGSLSSSAQGDCVKILCTTANTGFTVLSSIGNLSVV